MHTTRSQRWRDKRCHWIPNASEINPKHLAVDVISTKQQAAPFVQTHHYTASMPVARLSIGLFANARGGRSQLVGVCVFSHPVNDASVPKNAGLENPRTACDLGRLVLLDQIAGNGESWFLARALRILRQEKPEILSVISYADPVRRVDERGHIFQPGHVGSLYSVMGSRYVGRSSARTDLIMPNGRPIPSRTISKIRAGDTGHRYATEELLRAGARARHRGETPSEWLANLERTGFLLRRRHPGNHAYLFPLTKAARIAARKVPSLPYPILDRAAIEGDVTALPLFTLAA